MARELKVGDPAWWRGMRMKITSIDGQTFTYETVAALIEDPDWKSREGGVEGRTMPAYVCTSNVADAKWDDEFGFWYLPGGPAGELPKAEVAEDGTLEIVDPDIPTCICTEALGHEHGEICGTITWMAGPLCNSCRVANAAVA